MVQEHKIVTKVYEAKGSSQAADELVRQYLPFIKSETAKFLRRPPMEGHDDELSIAMFAFHEAVLAYQRGRGAFLPLAARAIQNRLIDYRRKESRHSNLLSLDASADEQDEEGPTLLEKLDTGHDPIAAHHQRTTIREELAHFAAQLASFGLKLTDIAENCPRQNRTLDACHRALAYAREHPLLLEQLVATGKVPLGPLAAGSRVERKTLERHRKYLVAILLAYTNGFEIIRGHLRQMAPQKV